jgi:hypothetical protein
MFNRDILYNKYETAINNNDLELLKEALYVKNKDTINLFGLYANICAKDGSIEAMTLFLEDPRMNIKRRLFDIFSMACQYGNYEVVKFLLTRNNEILTKKNYRKIATGWFLAEQEGFTKIIFFLFKNDYFHKAIRYMNNPTGNIIYYKRLEEHKHKKILQF